MVSAVLEEQHKVFLDCLNEAKDAEQQQHRVDLRMLWETVGLRVSYVASGLRVNRTIDRLLIAAFFVAVLL